LLTSVRERSLAPCRKLAGSGEGSRVAGRLRHVRRIAFDAKHELRAGEDALETHLDAAFEAPLSPPGLVEAEHRPNVPICDGLAIRAASQRREDLPSALTFAGLRRARLR
jgi:hypothetical protein